MADEIAVIVKTTNSNSNSNSNFWQNVNRGATAAIEGQAEHTMTSDGPAAETDIADQVDLVENAANRGAAGIVLAPSDPDALARSTRGASRRASPWRSSTARSAKGPRAPTRPSSPPTTRPRASLRPG